MRSERSETTHGRIGRSERLFAAIVAVLAAMKATEAVRRSSVVASLAKEDASPVTVADFASQAVVATILARVLSAIDPSAASIDILGEESDTMLRDPSQRAILDEVVAAARAADPSLDAAAVLDALAAPRADPSRSDCWTLDPVDGTKGFLRGGQYAICLAWIEAGRPVVGAMACPRLSLDVDDPSAPVLGGVVAAAAKGAGAWWAGADALELDDGTVASSGAGPLLAQMERLQTPPWTRDGAGGGLRPIRLALSFEKAHGDASAAEVLAARCGPLAEPLRLDSASKYVLVAHGRADVYLRIPHGTRKEQAWDHAAGVVIAEEAGCCAIDLDGRPLDFGRGATLSANRGIIVAPEPLARALVAAGGAGDTVGGGT
jgi:3'(2'), 5'-bisphosphate nucleotidase